MAVNLSPVAGAAAQFLDNSGNVLTGGKLYTYAAGTTTPQASYTSGTGVTFHSNPIILDAAGRVPAGGEIWLTDGLQYKFVLTDANDVLIGTWDNLIGINSNFLNFYTQEEIQTATAGQTVFTLSTVTYTPGTNSISVFVDGVNQYDGSSYAYVETDSTTITFTAGLHVGALVKFTTAVSISAGATTADLVVYDPPFTGGVATTVEVKLAQTANVMDFGAVNDGVTDNTASILSAAINSGQKLLAIPPNVKYNRTSLLSNATFPTDVVLFDLSEINDFSAAGETTKHIGVVSKDTASNDTHWAIDSGHHAITTLNNFGTAGTASASARKASVLWAAGQFTQGATNKRGFRGAALLQFTQDAPSDFWMYQLRSQAPWAAIADEYEYWASGEIISSTGVYVSSNSQIYVSASTGTTGATAPNWTSGTSSDGGVNWTWVDSADRSVFSVRQDNRWLLGGGSFSATWRHKVSAVDTSGNYSFQGEATGVSKSATLELIPTTAGGVASPQPYLMALDGTGLKVMRSDNTTDIAIFSDTGGLITKEFATTFTTNTSTGATPSVDGVGTLYINNAGATSITDLTSSSNGQIVSLVFANANTTLVSSATFLLQGSINVTPTTYSVVTMMRVPSSISSRWIEVSRSIK